MVVLNLPACAKWLIQGSVLNNQPWSGTKRTLYDVVPGNKQESGVSMKRTSLIVHCIFLFLNFFVVGLLSFLYCYYCCCITQNSCYGFLLGLLSSIYIYRILRGAGSTWLGFMQGKCPKYILSLQPHTFFICNILPA